MSEIVNLDQAQAWDGPEGEYWALHQERFDQVIAPHHTQLMGAAAITAGEQVLDIGCGNGKTSRDAARAADPGGEVLGVDLSGPMLGKAEELAKSEGLGNVRFLQADAQVHRFDTGTFDVVMSRFGVMFFEDPPAAFANIASAVRDGGRLAMLTWGPPPANEWIVAIGGALIMGRELPPPPPGTPGPFSLADPDLVRRLLTGAGFTEVDLAPSEHQWNVGTDIDDAYDFIRGLPPVLAMLKDLDEPTKAQALANLRGVVADHHTDDGILFGSSAWVVTARKP